MGPKQTHPRERRPRASSSLDVVASAAAASTDGLEAGVQLSQSDAADAPDAESVFGPCPTGPADESSAPAGAGAVSSVDPRGRGRGWLEMNRNRRRRRPASWYLVWCHERCFKEDMQDIKQRIGEVTGERGGILICARKSNKFLAWLQTKRQYPYALVLEWREAKPVWQGILGSPGEQLPVACVIVCEQSSVTRVTTWAATCPPMVPIVTVAEYDAAIDAVQQLVDGGALGGDDDLALASALA